MAKCQRHFSLLDIRDDVIASWRVRRLWLLLVCVFRVSKVLRSIHDRRTWVCIVPPFLSHTLLCNTNYQQVSTVLDLD